MSKRQGSNFPHQKKKQNKKKQQNKPTNKTNLSRRPKRNDAARCWCTRRGSGNSREPTTMSRFVFVFCLFLLTFISRRTGLSGHHSGRGGRRPDGHGPLRGDGRLPQRGAARSETRPERRGQRGAAAPARLPPAALLDAAAADADDDEIQRKRPSRTPPFLFLHLGLYCFVVAIPSRGCGRCYGRDTFTNRIKKQTNKQNETKSARSIQSRPGNGTKEGNWDVLDKMKRRRRRRRRKSNKSKKSLKACEGQIKGRQVRGVRCYSTPSINK